MSAYDLDPQLLVPLWQALVRYFRAHPPLLQAPQQLELPLPRRAQRKAQRTAQARPYLPKQVERRLPPQPSP